MPATPNLPAVPPSEPPSAAKIARGVVVLLCGVCGADTAAVRQLWGVLVHTCVANGSFQRSIRHLDGLPSATAVRNLLQPLLGTVSIDVWEDRLNAALRARWLPFLRGRKVVLVGDETMIPYWGKVTGELPSEVRGGQAKRGTKNFFGYLTVCALWGEERVLLGVTRWRPGEPLATAMARIGEPLLEGGLAVDSWMWDRGGDQAAMFDWLWSHGQRFAVAASRRGKKAGVAAILTRLEDDWGWSERRPPCHGQWYTMVPAEGSPVELYLVVAWEPVKVKPGERRQRSLRRAAARPGQLWRAVAWFTDGSDWRCSGTAVQKRYRRRQSIESSYRMSHGCRGRTSSRDPLYRFVLFAVSQLLQNEWRWYRWGWRSATDDPRACREAEHWWFVDFCFEVREALAKWLRRRLKRWWSAVLLLRRRAAATGEG